MKPKCETCINDRSVGWTGLYRLGQCEMENDRNIYLGYPDPGPQGCILYCRIPGSDDDLGDGE